jgi:hypothetical protein
VLNHMRFPPEAALGISSGRSHNANGQSDGGVKDEDIYSSNHPLGQPAIP